MKLNIAIFLGIASTALAICCNSCAGGEPEQNIRFTDYVNPFIGTDGHGHVFLGANVPFGMVQLGPSQPVKGWDWCSGYHYSDTTLLGFSHLHLSGTGIGDLGDILLLPATDELSDEYSFSHTDELCRPGYYKVYLPGPGILAELTASTRTGMHRYTFPTDADSAYIKLNLEYGIGWDRPTETRIFVDNDSTISGYRRSTGWAEDQSVFFTIVFSRPFVKSRGNDSLASLAFAQTGEPLLVKTGLSAVSIENARNNLLHENAGWNFDAVADAADEAWNTHLSKASVQSNNIADKRKFYTALYHTMFAPAVFSDVNGDYRGADGNIYNTEGEFTAYTIFSLWDTYRAAHPLSTLIHPELQADYARTFVDIYRRQGKLPVWHLHGNETNCMIGNPGVIVLGDLVMKGFVSDTASAYEAMKASVLLDERSLSALKEYGYVPYDAPDCNESVAKGLEYAIADDAVAKVAAALGRNEDAAYFSQRAKAYECYFDPASRFMRGKSVTSTFRPVEDFDPFAAAHRANDYCEGNAWQYVWLVPHDPHGLMALFPDEDSFTNKLDSLFCLEGDLGNEASPDISGMIGQYAHGNEPGHHCAYLYNYAGQPHKAAPILRKIINELYLDAPDGLCGNEDVGQMSAWFVLSSAGLYQVEPTGGKFVFGTPLFDSVKFDVGNGKTFQIEAVNNSADNIYIQSVSLDGEAYDKSYITYSRIKDGGVLKFVMGPHPSATFGIETSARP